MPERLVGPAGRMFIPTFERTFILTLNNLVVQKLGKTFHANHPDINGLYATSALDHAYVTGACEVINAKALDRGGSDHDPIFVSIRKVEKKERPYTRYVVKRSFRSFNMANF